MKNILNEEDIKFLKNLANELITQDTACTAKPIFHQIREKKNVIGVDRDYSDGEVLLISEDNDDFYENTLDAAKEYMSDNYGVTKKKLKLINSLSDLHDFCEDNDIRSTYTGYQEIEKFSNCFLTRKALDNHVRLNHYHYKNNDSYIDHAFRNPELETLLKIVEKFAEVNNTND